MCNKSLLEHVVKVVLSALNDYSWVVVCVCMCMSVLEYSTANEGKLLIHAALAIKHGFYYMVY